MGEPGEYVFPRISGVAPHANIVSYQICFPQPGQGCLTHLAVEAVEHAIAHGVHVLNYSIGGGVRDPWVSADTLAFLAARAAGIHVATSAGNSGPEPSTLMTPSNAPWLSIVAAYTHDRGYSEPTLTDFSSTGTEPLETLNGKGVTAGYAAPILRAADFGDARCLNPFPRNTFNGEIVVCERGINARVHKGVNVAAGGAGGMILVNVPNGADDTVADFHVLPAIHLDIAAGQALMRWISEGADHQARITAGEPAIDRDAADIAGFFSSRGPALPHMSVPSPHMAAPGVDIYAAWTQDQPFINEPFETPYAFLNGTSMASPHVAGALALLAQMHPDWTPMEVKSALMTTGRFHGVRKTDAATPADAFDIGGGRIDAGRAARAGLVLDETRANFDAAYGGAGNQTTLNLASFANQACAPDCAWTSLRRIRRTPGWGGGYGPSSSIAPRSRWWTKAPDGVRSTGRGRFQLWGGPSRCRR
jgi:subtilisin family serine protease